MLAFAIKSIVFLSIMYIPYMLLLRKESFFHFNRLMLISIMALALVLPLCNFHALSLGSNIMNQQLNAVIEIGMPIASPLSPQGGSLAVEKSGMEINWWSVISLIYIIGVAVALLVKVAQLALLYRNINKGVLWTEKKDGITIYCHASNIAPFSWFNTIVISEDDYNNNAKEILTHEMGHIANHHSLDILLLNIVEVIQWCNPLSWILANSLRDVNEYEADDAVLRSGINAHQYQSLLIKKAVGSSSYAFANSFNHSLLKKRITMMLKKKSNPWMRSKALYILPVACIALSAFATPELNEKIESVVEPPSVSGGKVTNVSEIMQISDAEIITNDSVAKSNGVSKPIKITNDKSSNIRFGQRDDKVPLLVIDKKISTWKDLDALDPNNVASINVLKEKAALESYGEKGKYGVIELFTKSGQSDEIVGSDIHEKCDKMPEYVGGMQGLMQFVAQNVRYPAIAHECGVNGRVVVQFVIDADGGVSETKVVHNSGGKDLEVKDDANAPAPDVTVIGYTKKDSEKQYLYTAELNTSKKALEEEAIRVIKLTNGKWTPGEEKGEKVRVRYTMPITFRLQ